MTVDPATIGLGFIQPDHPEYVQDGVHLGLPAERYFKQGLGSTDLMKLWKFKEGWWWQSQWNKRHRRVTTKDQNYGHATHTIVLEGVEVYDRRFIAEPDYAQIDGLFDSLDRAKVWLEGHGFSTKGAAYKGWVKEDWVKACVEGEVEIPWKAVIDEQFRQTIAGRAVEIIPAAEDESLRLLRDLMLDPERDDNEDIRSAFGDTHGFPVLAEVSIIHTLPNGVRRRWRIDRMFPSFDVDLKTLQNWQGQDLRFWCGDQIKRYGYDLQRADYRRAREIAYAYIAAGHIYGGDVDQRAWLETWPELYPQWDWKWIWLQKPDSIAGRAPVVFPLHDEWDGPCYLTGAQKATVAYNRFLTYCAKYGLDKPWARVEPQHYTDERIRDRSVFFPPWGDDIPMDELEGGQGAPE